MRRQYLSELGEGGAVRGAFLLRSKELRAARTGDAYLSLEIADKTGALGAVYFRPMRSATEIPVGSVVDVSGVVSTYRGMRRVSIDALKPASSWEPSDLIGSSVRPRSEMVSELRSLVGSVESMPLRGLLRVFFGDKGFRSEFERCPASLSSHHAYLGGLLEHSLAVAGKCARAADEHRSVDRDLLVTAALLHDVGRTAELTYHTGIECTQAGRLLGHVTLGVRLIHERGVAAHVDAQQLELLEHIVLTHHAGPTGESGMRPATLEALALHHIDLTDVSMAGFEHALTGVAPVGEGWTDSTNPFGRPLFMPHAVVPGPAASAANGGTAVLLTA